MVRRVGPSHGSGHAHHTPNNRELKNIAHRVEKMAENLRISPLTTRKELKRSQVSSKLTNKTTAKKANRAAGELLTE